MSRSKLSLAALLWTAASVMAPAQSTPPPLPQPESEAVRRVASHLACRCGSCKDVVSCPMSLQGCGFCNPAKKKIAAMQAAGGSDQSIIDAFTKEFGPDEYRAGPSQAFMIVPYALLAAGLLAIFWFIRRYYKAQGGPAAADSAGLDRYRDTIEKEMAKLD